MTIIQFLCSLLIGYLFGCFQTPYYISKFIYKKDIRKIGSGNAGASNITSQFGWKYGLLAALLDIFKAFLPTKIIIYFFPQSFFQLEIMIIAGTGAILGHIYPFFLDFKGGKGVACYIGMLLAINWPLGVIAIISLLLITIITDYISIGSIVLYTVIPFIYIDNSKIILFCFFVLFIVGILKHRINIKRIISGDEIGLRSVIKKNIIK